MFAAPEFIRNSRMTETEYEAERARLREIYGDSRKEAGARYEQALAALFYRSGWTQEELAAKEGKTQQWVAYRTRFGRFLDFTTAVVKLELLPKNLTEGKFRGYWEQTEGDERARFKAVLELIQAPNRPNIGREIVKQFADGKWHAREVIAKAINAEPDHVKDTVRQLKKLGWSGAGKTEIKPVGRTEHYRIFPRESKERMIGSVELVEKLGPIIESLKEQGKKGIAAVSPVTIATLAHELQLLLDGWAK